MFHRKSKALQAAEHLDGNTVYLVEIKFIKNPATKQFFLYTGVLTLHGDIAEGQYGGMFLRPKQENIPYWYFDGIIEQIKIIEKTSFQFL